MDFKLHEKCSECSEYDAKKKCKGYKFSIEIKSFYCPKYDKNKENKSEK